MLGTFRYPDKAALGPVLHQEMYEVPSQRIVNRTQVVYCLGHELSSPDLIGVMNSRSGVTLTERQPPIPPQGREGLG